MIAAMGSWRRKAATSGHNHTNTDLHGDWSPVVRLGLPFGPLIEPGSLLVLSSVNAQSVMFPPYPRGQTQLQ